MKLIRLDLLVIYLLGFINSEVTQVLPGAKPKTITMNNKCEGYQINTNFKHVQININNINNISKYLFTDYPHESCSTECNTNANICESNSYNYIGAELNNKSELAFSSRMCISSLYIYLIKQDESAQSTVDISTDYVLGENCVFIHQTPYAYCGESNLEDCRNC
jgi:hypothetical protein